jgi:hypothetical protein
MVVVDGVCCCGKELRGNGIGGLAAERHAMSDDGRR